MEIEEFISKMENMHQDLLAYLNNDDQTESQIEENNIVSEIQGNQQLLLDNLYLISNISNYHYRSPFFIERIERIISRISKTINENINNYELFKIFKKDKLILLFLIEQKIIKVDKTIANEILKYKPKANYRKYLYPEIEPFISEEISEEIKEKMEQELNFKKDIENFNLNRKYGENERYICQIIRNDSVKEFIIFINQTNTPLNLSIQLSIYETNPFLYTNEIDLIEYSAFYGSIQIFKYLYLNKVELKESLWPYAIHGNNPEIIHLLEENKIQYSDFFICFANSIRFHNNEFAFYFLNNFINNNIKDYSPIIKHRNFTFFPKTMENENIFYLLCKYNYITLVKILSNKANIDFNASFIYI